MEFEQLARIEREAGLRPANDNQHTLVDNVNAISDVDKDDTPTGLRFHRKSKEDVEAEASAEANRIAALRVRIGTRQQIGNPAAANNDLQSWPLLESLRRAGKDDLAEVAIAYRGLCVIVASQPLQGVDYQKTDGVNAEYRTEKMKGEKEIDAAHEAGWPTDEVPCADVVYKEVRKRKGGDFDIPARRAVAANDETRQRSRSMSIKFSMRTLLAKLDGRPILMELRAAAGPLIEALDDAALAGLTFLEIGEAAGFKSRQATAVGNDRVTQALCAVQAAWLRIERRERIAEKNATKTGLAARTAIEKRQAEYFGRASNDNLLIEKRKLG